MIFSSKSWEHLLAVNGFYFEIDNNKNKIILELRKHDILAL